MLTWIGFLVMLAPLFLVMLVAAKFRGRVSVGGGVRLEESSSPVGKF